MRSAAVREGYEPNLAAAPLGKPDRDLWTDGPSRGAGLSALPPDRTAAQDRLAPTSERGGSPPASAGGTQDVSSSNYAVNVAPSLPPNHSVRAGSGAPIENRAAAKSSGLHKSLGPRHLASGHAPRRRRRSLKAPVAIVAALAVILGGAALAGTYLVGMAAGGSSPGHGEVTFTVSEGQSLSEIADALERDGIIASSTSFLLYLRLNRKAPVVRAGEYRMRYDMGAEAVLAAFEAGPIPSYTNVTFPPGFTMRQQASRVEADLGLSGAAFLSFLDSNVDFAGFPEAPNAEGLCFPDTYRVDANTKEAELAAKCLSRFEEVFSTLDKSRLPSLDVTPYQAVIVASLVEREAKIEEERPLVASVIYNRLRRGMKLDIDATVLYAIGEHKERLTYDDLKIDSPYNTYRYPGLPPTPIATPSKASLEAAVNPASNDYIYYVLTDPSGAHSFTSSASEFERLKADAIARGVY